MTKVPTYYQYWGKAERGGERFHLLPYHCLDVAAVGHLLLAEDASLCRKFEAITGLDGSICRRWLLLFLALHDLGKFSESFQNLRPDLLEKLQNKKSTRPYAIRHDSLGNLLWIDHLWRTVEGTDPNIPNDREQEDFLYCQVAQLRGSASVQCSRSFLRWEWG